MALDVGLIREFVPRKHLSGGEVDRVGASEKEIVSEDTVYLE